MRVSQLTREALASRRQYRDLTKRGYELISCKFGVGRLWELDRGYRLDWHLTDAVLGVDGKSVYVRAEKQ